MLNNFKIASKLYLLVLILCFFIIGIGLYGISRLAVVNKNTETLYRDRVIPIAQLANIRYAYAVEILATANRARNNEITSVQALATIRQAEKNIATNWTRYKRTFLREDEKAQVKRIEARMPAAAAEVERLKAVLRKNDGRALDEFLASGFAPNITHVMSGINDLVHLQVTISADVYGKSVDVFEFTATKFYTLIALCLAFALVFSLLIVKNVRAMIRGVHESEQKYRGIFENLQDVYFQSTLDGTLIEISPSVFQVIGIRREALIGTATSALYSDITDREKGIELLFTEGQIKDHEIRFKAANGETIYGLMNVTLVRKSDGSPDYMEGMFKNITHRRKNEERLRQSTERLNEAQAVARMGSWEIDLTSRTHTWSDQIYKMYGIERGNVEPSTKALLSFIHPDDRQASEKLVQQNRQFPQDGWHDFRFIRQDGAVRFGHCRWRFEFDQNHQPIRLYGILQDITERKSEEVEKEKMIGDIMQRNKYFEEFSYIVSHNLRGDIVNIQGIAQVLRFTTSEQERLELLEYIFKSVNRLDDIIKVLNEIVQIRNVNTQDKEAVPLQQLLDETLTFLDLENDEINLEAGFEAPTVFAYRSGLFSIFRNLISNSAAFHQPGKKAEIRITSYAKDEKVILSFKDNGMGIDLSKHGNRLFGLAQRFHANAEGKGIGLFLVKAQVELHRGTIWVNSHLGSGTEVVIELPQL